MIGVRIGTEAGGSHEPSSKFALPVQLSAIAITSLTAAELVVYKQCVLLCSAHTLILPYAN